MVILRRSIFAMNTAKKIISAYLLATILLVSLICIRVYQGFDKLVDESFANLLTTNSKLALELIDSKYGGPWNIREDRLYKGDTLIDESFIMVDKIKEIVKGEVSVFLKDSRIATTVADEDGKRRIGTKAAAQVVEKVINEGDEYIDYADVLGRVYDTIYVPLKNDMGQVVGMFAIGVPREYISQITNASIYNIITWAVILVTIGTLLYNALTKKNIVRPLQVMQDHLKQIASGDFTKEIHARYLNKKDEFGEIANAVKEMCYSLKGMIVDIKEKSREVSASFHELASISQEMSASSQELAATIQQVADGSVKQAADLTEVVNLLSIFTKDIETANTELQKVKVESANVESNAEIGKREMDLLEESIEKMEKAFAQVVSRMEALANSVEEISVVTEIISDISEQTNLLALNAAIESARAGEYGRGFAVVAEEIRKLSAESKKSTERIKNLVCSITKDTEEVLSASKTVEQSAEEQISSVENTVNSFESILASIEKILPLMDKIYGAMDEIIKSKDIVMEKVRQISSVTQENSSSTEEVAASSEELTASSEEVASTAQSLSTIAMNLLEMANCFKI